MFKDEYDEYTGKYLGKALKKYALLPLIPALSISFEL